MMADSLGSVEFQISVDATQAEAGLQRVTKKVQETTQALTPLTGSMSDLRSRLSDATNTMNSYVAGSDKWQQAAKRVQVLQDHLGRSIDTASQALKRNNAVMHQTADRIGSFGVATNSTGYAMMNLTRVVQDAPFGFIAIQNNISPLVESFIRLKSETGSTGSAFKALLSSFTGPAGMLAILNIGISVLTMLSMSNRGAADATKTHEQAVKDLKNEYKNLTQAQLENALAKAKTDAASFQGSNIFTNGASIFGSLTLRNAGAMLFGSPIVPELTGDYKKALANLDAVQQIVKEHGREREVLAQIAQLEEKRRQLKKDDPNYLASLKSINTEIATYRNELKIIEGSESKVSDLRSSKNAKELKEVKELRLEAKSEMHAIDIATISGKRLEIMQNRLRSLPMQSPVSMPQPEQQKWYASQLSESIKNDPNIIAGMKTYSLLSNALADTLRDNFSKSFIEAWDRIFGHADSLLEQFLQNLTERIGLLAIDEVSGGIFGFVKGLFGIVGGSDRTITIQNTMVVDGDVLMESVVTPRLSDSMGRLQRTRAI